MFASNPSRREALAAGALALTDPARTKEPNQIFRIGVLSASIGGKPQKTNGHTWHFAQYFHPTVNLDVIRKYLDPGSAKMFADILRNPRCNFDALPFAGSPTVKSIPVAATVGHVPMVLHVIPVRGSARDIFTQATALLVVTPVDRAAVPAAEVLQGLFDLTPAEARVARGIGQAETIDTLADATGVNRETVRSQLKAVLSKTGLSRQQELVSLLAGKAFRGG